MTYKNVLVVLSLQFIATISFGQEGTFTTLERKIENRIPKSEMPENKGWKAEHRWLDEFKKRVDPNGNFYDGEIFYAEAERLAKLKNENNQKMTGWIPVGPTERADASLTKGMGRINCIAFHPTDASTYWVGVAQGGVWKTTDSGQNWTPLTDDLPILRISDIAVDSNDPDNIYICVGDYAYIDVALSLDDRKRHSHYGIGVYKTTDGGTSWNPTGLTYQLTQLDGSLMRRVFIDPANADNLVAAGTGGIWTSSDAGVSWTATSDSLIWDIEADPNNPYTLYASSGHLRNSDTGTTGIMKSVDFGATWNWLSTGIPTDGSALRVEIAVAPTNSNHIYAIACNDESGFYGLYSSLDAGVTWTYSDAGGKNILEWYGGSGPGGQGWYDLSILVDPNDEMTVYTGGVNIWGSSDGGVSFDGVSIWYDGAGPGLHADQHQFKYNPLDDKFYVCNDGGLVRTDTIIIGSWDDANQGGYQWPTTWEYMSDGMQTSSFYTVSISEGNPGSFISGAQDNSTYYNNAGNWSNLFGGDGMDCLLHPVDSDVIFGSSQYGRILYSDNGGGGYTQMNAPSGEDGEWVTPFMYEPGNTDLVYAGFGNLHSAFPGSDFNTPLSNFNDMPGAGFPSPISNFTIAESDISTIYVAKRIYHSYNQLSEFWVTDDGGATWSDKTSGLPDSMYFTHVEVDNDNPSSVWAGVAGFEDGKHVYHSVDGGDNWINISLDLPNLPVNCIVHRDESVQNTIYVGTDIGVYYTNDTMTGWLAYNQSLPNVIVSDLEINYGENKLYAATFGRGVWKTDLITDSLSNVGLNEMNPLENTTLDLYPNPNTGEFTLNIQDFEGNALSMEVINVMGETIKSQELTINGASFEKTFDFDLSNGMYFLKVSSGIRMQTVRFVVK